MESTRQGVSSGSFGATENPVEFSLYSTIQSLHEKHSVQAKNTKHELLVLHTHSHSHSSSPSDHYGADSQFQNKPNTTVITPHSDQMKELFTFDDWPNQYAEIDLGSRSLTIIPTPGHQEDAISIYGFTDSN